MITKEIILRERHIALNFDNFISILNRNIHQNIPDWHYRHDGMYAGFPAGCLADNQGLDVELGNQNLNFIVFQISLNPTF